MIKFLDNQKAQDMTVTLILFGVVIVLTVFSMFILNPIHKKNITKLKSNKPIDRQKIIIDNIVGTVESIHPCLLYTSPSPRD